MNKFYILVMAIAIGFINYRQAPGVVHRSITAIEQTVTKNKKYISIESFGAKANDTTFDNAPAIIRALNSTENIVIPANKIFTTRSVIQATKLSGRSIIAKNATIVNRNYDARTFLFIDCDNIKITGGYYTRNVLPTVQNGKSQSTIGFQTCKNVSVSGVHINRSPEMGIDNNIVIGGTFTNNLIEHCLRDGIYAHYSANLKYIGNTLNEIKDDALSMHDYGLDAQKSMLHQAGYQQAGHSTISSNTILNSIQGISSIGCTDITISKNNIKNTANAGICIFNSEDLFLNSTARVNNIKIINNKLYNTDYSVTVNGIVVKNNGQITSGRAAIFVACNRQGKAFTTSKMRSSLVTVLNNTVTNSAVNAATLYNIDGLIVQGNSFINCHSDTKNAPEYTGDIVEILNCSKINISGNQVIDSRAVVLHNRAYNIENSSGTFQKGISRGFKVTAVSMMKSQIKQ